MNKKYSLPFLLSFFFFHSCYTQKGISVSGNKVKLSSKLVNNVSLFSETVFFDDAIDKKAGKHINLIYNADSLAYIIVGKKKYNAKSNFIYSISRFKGGWLIVHNGKYRYSQVDSVLFLKDYCFKKTTIYDIDDTLRVTIPEMIYYKGYYFGEQDLFMLEENWQRNRQGEGIETLYEYSTKKISRFITESALIKINYAMTRGKTKEMEKLLFCRWYLP